MKKLHTPLLFQEENVSVTCQLLMRPNERLPPPLPPSPQVRDAYTASIQWPT